MKRLNWGMIGGGKGSQIGPAHRIAAGLDGYFTFAAGALDADPAAGRAFAVDLGLAADRAYGDWREMLEGERGRADRVDLVTVATPNSTHYEISKAFLEAGINVLCEKPMTVTEAEAEDLVLTARRTGAICAVNYGYTVMRWCGTCGRWSSAAISARCAWWWPSSRMATTPMRRMRTTRGCAGAMTRRRRACRRSSRIAASMHCTMASFVTGQEVARLSSDFASCLPSRVLEDDAMVNFRMDGGAVGRLWTSSVAIGRQHGLTIQVFGETGGLRWAQEQPNQLYYMPLGQRLQVIERGEGNLSPRQTGPAA